MQAKVAGLEARTERQDYAGTKVTTDDAAVLSLAKHPNTVTGDFASIMMVGTARLHASGAITAGTKVVLAAAGGVMVAGVIPANIIGTAINAATDGGFVDILMRHRFARALGMIGPELAARDQYMRLANSGTIPTWPDLLRHPHAVGVAGGLGHPGVIGLLGEMVLDPRGLG